MQIIDPDVQLLAAVAGSIAGDYLEADAAWEGSPFAWIKTRPSRQVGAIGEQLIAGWCAAKNFNVLRSPDSDADRVIEGIRVEIKFSTLWQNGGYKFQQLRDQNYDAAVCLGVSPFDAHCWVIPKPAIMAGWGKLPGLVPQHGGSAGRDTAWLSVTVGNVWPWLKPYGGRLSDATKLIGQLANSSHPKRP